MSSPAALSLRSLVRALALSEGPEQLAAELQLSPSHLKLMLEGVSDVPEETFLRVVDLLIDRSVAALGQRKSEAKALANALANLPTGRRIAQSSFKWLPMDAFERLAQEQKETYLTEIIKQLGLHP